MEPTVVGKHLSVCNFILFWGSHSVLVGSVANLFFLNTKTEKLSIKNWKPNLHVTRRSNIPETEEVVLPAGIPGVGGAGTEGTVGGDR